MSKDNVTVLNTYTGKVGVIRRRLFENSAFNTYLVAVEADKKSYDSSWKPRTAEEYLQSRGYLTLGEVYPVELPAEAETEPESETD